MTVHQYLRARVYARDHLNLQNITGYVLHKILERLVGSNPPLENCHKGIVFFKNSIPSKQWKSTDSYFTLSTVVITWSNKFNCMCNNTKCAQY